MNNREQLRKWYRNIPDLYHGSFRRQWIKALQRKSMKAAIQAKCQDCMCWQNTEVNKYKSPCGAEGEEKARYPQGLDLLFISFCVYVRANL